MLHSICQKIWKAQQYPQDWKRPVFIPVPKKVNRKECSSEEKIAQSCPYCSVMSKSWIWRRQRNERSNCQHLLDHQKSKRVPEKHLLLYWLCQSLWLCGSEQIVEKFFKMGLLDHLTCLLRNHYEDEATVKTGHQTNWFQIGKGVHQSYICCHSAYLTYMWVQFSSVQSLCHVWPFVTPQTTARQASLSINNSWGLPKSMFIESVMPSNHHILCCPFLLLLSIFPNMRVFSHESSLHIRWPKYWSFSFSISPFNEYPGLISFRMGWLDLLAVQGTQKSLLQYHSSKVSIHWHSTFFIVQLSHLYLTTEKTITLTRWTFVEKVMSLLFNMLSRLVITFLPRSKLLLISLLQSPSAVILEPRKIKSATVSTVSPSICHEVICRVHHEKCWAGWSRSWNQDCWEEYQ